MNIPCTSDLYAGNLASTFSLRGFRFRVVETLGDGSRFYIHHLIGEHAVAYPIGAYRGPSPPRVPTMTLVTLHRMLYVPVGVVVMIGEQDIMQLLGQADIAATELSIARHSYAADSFSIMARMRQSIAELSRLIHQ